jgi:hypothetical protein
MYRDGTCSETKCAHGNHIGILDWYIVTMAPGAMWM